MAERQSVVKSIWYQELFDHFYSEEPNGFFNLDIRKRQELFCTFFIQNNNLICQPFCRHSPYSNKANIVPKFSHKLLNKGFV